ncbi:MAG: transglutaminase-like domain-containing protein [Actinomycetia bacterium]|nr:transglutaminase-like domain-containing protein [Actinomycetes bacterium]
MSLASLRRLARSLWLVALIWPYAWVSGLPHAGLLAFTPVALAGADDLPAAWARWTVRALVVLGGATLAVGQLPSSGDHALLLWTFYGNALLGFFGGVTAGWFFFRQPAGRIRLLGLLVGGLALLVLDHLAWRFEVTAPALAYLGLGLVLLADASRQVEAPPGADWLLVVGASAAVVVACGWLMPPLPARAGPAPGSPSPSLRDPLDSAPVAPESARTGLGIGDTDINHPVTPSSTLVLTVSGVPAPAYWQVAVYDHFDGVRWSASPGPVVPYGPGQVAHLFFPPDVTGFPLVAWHPAFAVADPQNVPALPYTGTPTAVGDTGSRAYGAVLEGREELVNPGYRRYTLALTVPEIAPAALAAASFTPAPSPLARDLQVPANLAPAVGTLAREATRGATGPWQAAQDLVRFLDTHEHYTYHYVPTTGGNAVNQFLLNTHAGYCDQFSTSFVMMARLLGIPARWVIGFGPGQYDSRTGSWRIRALDAHSWAQIYIAPYGWIAVDPTPGWAVPGSITPDHPPNGSSDAAGGVLQPEPPGHWLAPVRNALAAAAGAVLLAALGRHRLRRRSHGDRAARIDRTLRRLLRRAGYALPPHGTPRDLIGILDPAHQKRLQPVVEVLERFWYAPEPPSADAVAQAEKALQDFGRTLGRRPAG